MGVFVSELSSPFDWIRQRIADRLIQASGIALESSGTRIRLPVDDENALHRAIDAQGIVSEAGPVDQLVPVKVVSDAALDDLVASEEIRHYPDHERFTNSKGIW